MKATHFIEVWRFSDGRYAQSEQPWLIITLQSAIKHTKGVQGNTIAIFKIRPTDVPLNERLERRNLIAGTVNVPDWMLNPLNSPS